MPLDNQCITKHHNCYRWQSLGWSALYGKNNGSVKTQDQHFVQVDSSFTIVIHDKNLPPIEDCPPQWLVTGLGTACPLVSTSETPAESKTELIVEYERAHQPSSHWKEVNKGSPAFKPAFLLETGNPVCVKYNSIPDSRGARKWMDSLQKITSISCPQRTLHHLFDSITWMSLALARAFVFPSRILHPEQCSWETWCHVIQRLPQHTACEAGKPQQVSDCSTGTSTARAREATAQLYLISCDSEQRQLSEGSIKTQFWLSILPCAFINLGNAATTLRCSKEKILQFKCQHDASWHSLPVAARIFWAVMCQ